jgi:hypothetical protein
MGHRAKKADDNLEITVTVIPVPHHLQPTMTLETDGCCFTGPIQTSCIKEGDSEKCSSCARTCMLVLREQSSERL